MAEETCPKCGEKAKITFHYPKNDKGETRRRKEFHHSSGSHTVEMKE